MSNLHLTILFLVIATLCCVLHFVLGTVLTGIAGFTLFGVWTGAGAWCSWLGLVNLFVFWMSCIQISRLFNENIAAKTVDESLQSIKRTVDAMKASRASGMSINGVEPTSTFASMVLNPLPESSCTCKS